MRQQFHFAEVRYTAEVEKQLDLIAESKAQYLDTVKAIYTRLQNEISRFQTSILMMSWSRLLKELGVASTGVCPCYWQEERKGIRWKIRH